MKIRTTKTGNLKEHLVREMSDLRIPIGGRLPSETELMDLFFLSRSNVRQVLSELTIRFDDVNLLPDQSPWLATSAQPKHRMGQQAARQLVQRIRSPRNRTVSLLLEGRLIQRTSTAPPREMP